MTPKPGAVRPTASFLVSLGLLALGFLPMPGGWARSARSSLRATDLNRADREAGAGGYYEGLLAGVGAPRDTLTLRLAGRPAERIRFHDIDAMRILEDDYDPLQFELKPGLRRVFFGKPFTSNALGLRDRETTAAKPAGTFRIALLGSSMDMGWGVGTDETYENRLEDWLNAQAAARGLTRRFEVQNFAVAAYSPLHRLEVFCRKVAACQPDLVLYAATPLDTRLLEIHLGNLMQVGARTRYESVRREVAAAGLTPGDLRLDARGDYVDKEAIKAKLQPHLWAIAGAAIGELAEQCRARGVPLACVIVPRVSDADALADRAPAIGRLRAVAARHAIPLIDLSAAFDGQDPAAIEIAAWDDHPNVRGHNLLFRGLARALVDDPAWSALLFPGPAQRREATP